MDREADSDLSHGEFVDVMHDEDCASLHRYAFERAQDRRTQLVRFQCLIRQWSGTTGLHYRMQHFSPSLAKVVCCDTKRDPEEVCMKRARRVVLLPRLKQDDEHLVRQVFNVVWGYAQPPQRSDHVVKFVPECLDARMLRLLVRASWLRGRPGRDQAQRSHAYLGYCREALELATERWLDHRSWRERQVPGKGVPDHPVLTPGLHPKPQESGQTKTEIT